MGVLLSLTGVCLLATSGSALVSSQREARAEAAVAALMAPAERLVVGRPRNVEPDRVRIELPRQRPVLRTGKLLAQGRPIARKVTTSAIDPEAAPPASLSIPRIEVNSPLVGLSIQRGGTLEVPTDYAVPGWFRNGTKPGDIGPAVVIGHLDSETGPAVFYRVRELRSGDRVRVSRTDGSVVVFAVYKSEQVSKRSFPTARVYGPTRAAELRLLTCSGPFDVRAGNYEDNFIVYARRVKA